MDSYGNEFNACPKCCFRWCPKANDPAGKCEVVNDVNAERTEAMLTKPLYTDKVVAKRAALAA